MSAQGTIPDRDSTRILQDSYEELISEVTYEKNTSKLLPRKASERKPKKAKERDQPADLSWLNGGLYRGVMYFFIAVLVLLVLYLLLQNISISGKDVDLPVTELEEDEIENIEEVDTDTGYAEAMAAGDYRRACRMIFLKVLQRLEVTEKIRWKKEKTNRDYLREMAGDSEVAIFRDIVNTYEYVWYGDKPIDSAGIRQYAEQAGHMIPLKLPVHE